MGVGADGSAKSADAILDSNGRLREAGRGAELDYQSMVTPMDVDVDVSGACQSQRLGSTDPLT